MSSITQQKELSIVPLGPGDLIDRAVRFYRANFVTFIFIAAPPVLIGTLLIVGWRALTRMLFPEGANAPATDAAVYYVFSFLGTASIWTLELVIILSVMGGASRNFVRHLLFGERIAFSQTYRNTISRAAGLIMASLMITLILGVVGTAIFYFGLIITSLLAVLAIAALQSAPSLAAVVAVVFVVIGMFFSAMVFFLVASRFAYVPQVMLVEGRSVFQALGRSVSLAKGNVRRFTALFIFTIVATYSALAIFYIPLVWYAWLEGVDLSGFDNDLTPAWFEIASQLISQGSIVLLSPIWMIGLCLLYVDERVRHEGYDIELLAAQRIGNIPDVPEAYRNPLQPALSGVADPVANSGSVNAKSGDLLGLK